MHECKHTHARVQANTCTSASTHMQPRVREIASTSEMTRATAHASNKSVLEETPGPDTVDIVLARQHTVIACQRHVSPRGLSPPTKCMPHTTSRQFPHAMHAPSPRQACGGSGVGQRPSARLPRLACAAPAHCGTLQPRPCHIRKVSALSHRLQVNRMVLSHDALSTLRSTRTHVMLSYAVLAARALPASKSVHCCAHRLRCPALTHTNPFSSTGWGIVNRNEMGPRTCVDERAQGDGHMQLPPGQRHLPQSGLVQDSSPERMAFAVTSCWHVLNLEPWMTVQLPT